MNQLKITAVSSQEDLAVIGKLAEKIWKEYYTSLLGEAQVAYMLKNIQSPAAMEQQIREDGYCYYLLSLDGQPAGYMATQCGEDNRLFLSKLYLSKEQRGKHVASQAFGFLEDFCRERGISKIWLTVNKGNSHAKDVYLARGFTTIAQQEADIGSGFVMDDYIMEKTL